ncbi:MAG TPA: penicillin-insensitive murein endopeptidase [Polyangiales bacterium]|nr:penicillin-insensitive murein endopeptidase [Polyangiales bacterium]
MSARSLLSIGLCVGLLCSAQVASAQRASLRAVAEVNLRPPANMRSKSAGYPWEGTLARGMKLKESRYVRYISECEASGDRFYGTWQLVQLLERAARGVAARYPGAKLAAGELSSKEGGDVGGHSSHESGRDADIGFYILRGDGKPYQGATFASFNAAGRSVIPGSSLRFDDARNWELISKLVTDREARVQYIFVHRSIRARLLREAARRKAPADVINRAESVLVEPARGNKHRTHFHVRIYCATSDRPQCRDVAPYWAWYPGMPPRDASSAHAALPAPAPAPSPQALLTARETQPQPVPGE